MILVLVRAEDDAHDCTLDDLIMLEAAALVYLEHEGEDLVKLARLIINHSNHVHSIGGHVFRRAQVHVLEAHVDEFTLLFSIC
jgi:hypothetical protein